MSLSLGVCKFIGKEECGLSVSSLHSVDSQVEDCRGKTVTPLTPCFDSVDRFSCDGQCPSHPKFRFYRLRFRGREGFHTLYPVTY